MAESVGSSSVYLSSDVDIDPCCEPCGKTGRLTEPAGYCPKCIEFFCQTCLDVHSRLGITANHKTQTGEDMPKSLADKPLKYQICEIHDGESQDRFCFDHSRMVCGICSIREHEKCEVKPLMDAIRTFPVKLSKMDQIDAEMEDDKEECSIWGLDVTAEGNILFADCNNSRIKLISPTGQLLSSLYLPNAPIDITVINESEAAVSMEDNKQIGVIDISDSARLSIKSLISTDNYVWGLAAYSNNLIITSNETPDQPSSVQRINMRGDVVWTATRDMDGDKLFDWARFLVARSGEDGGTVVVSDFGKETLTVLDASSGKVRKICDVKRKEPRGITADYNGNVYVCYRMAQEVCVWTGDMDKEKCLVTGNEILHFPFAIACDHRRCSLFLSYVAGPSSYLRGKCRFVEHFTISRK